MDSCKGIIVIDGDCSICNNFAKLIDKLDRRYYLCFASNSSKIGGKLLKKYGLEDIGKDSVLFIVDGKIYSEMEAIMEILSTIHPLFRVSKILKILPNKVRSYIYRLVAKNRYLFQKKGFCEVPEKSFRDRFID